MTACSHVTVNTPDLPSIGRSTTLTAPENPARWACGLGKQPHCQSPGVHLGAVNGLTLNPATARVLGGL